MKIAKFVNLKEALPRIIGDFAVIHVAAIVSLFGAVYVHLSLRPEADIRMLLDSLRGFYLARFLPLSLIFPAVFSLNGLYSTSRAYPLRYKYWVVLRSALTALLIYFFVSFIVTGKDLMPRSSILLFAVLISSGLVATRWMKSILWRQEESQRKTTSANSAPAPILVVGGAGYIGSLLCRQLLRKGHSVRVLDSLVYGESAIRDLLGNSKFELQQGDCRNIQHVVRAFGGVKSVIHLAAIVGDPACDLDRTSALEVNYASTRMMIEIAKGERVERFVFASSCSVYGATDILMDENAALATVSLYGQTKVDSERALLEAGNADFHPVILRLATVFGASFRPRFDLVVNLLTAKAFADGIITIYNGSRWRPFIHVRDAGRGFVEAIDSPLSAVSGEVFNLGDNRLNLTFADLADQVRTIFPNTRIERVENSDQRNYRVSFEKIHRRLGFQCAMSLADGIEELKRALETGSIADYRDILYHNQRFLANSGATARGRLQTDVMAAFSAGGGQ